MRLPWISQRQPQRGSTRRKHAAPLKVRRLERRRVLDAAVTDLVFAPADLDPSTAAHDSNEATPITVSANATGTGTLTYDWQLTQGASVIASGSNPTFQFTPLDNGNYSVKLTVTDGDATTDSRTEDVVVHNLRPVLFLALDQQVKEGQTLNLSAIGGAPALGIFVDSGILDTHTATINWGDGSAAEAADIYAGAGSGALGGTHVYTSEGEFTVTVSITDDDGGTDTKSFLVKVINGEPTATLGNSGPVNEGSSATVTFTNQFDPNPADAAAGFRYAYDFNNDGTFDLGDGTYAGSVAADSQIVSAALLAEGPGSHTVRARIIDKDNGFTDYTTSITIDNVAPALVNLAADDATINEGQTATIRMTVDDPSASDVFSVDVDWKDGDPVDTIGGLGLVDANGTVGNTTYQWDAETRQLTVTHLYEDDNPTGTTSDTYAVALVVRDDDLGASNPYNVNITVSNVRPVLVVATDQAVDEGTALDLSGVGGAPSLGLFVDDGDADTHTATVDWGDGSAIESTTIFPAPGAGALGGSHTYKDDGVYTVTVTVTDDDGGVDTQQFEVTVGNVPPVLFVAANQNVNEGSLLDLSAIGGAPSLGLFVDAGILDTHTATVDWGDGSSVESPAIFPAPGSGALGGTHTYQEDGIYTVTVTITDDDGGTDTAQFMVTVSNVAPVLFVAADQTVSEGSLLDLSGTGGAPSLGLFVDPGILDTHTATVDWGDGSSVESSTVFQAPGSGTLGGTHTYQDNGTYTVTVTVTDDEGHSDTETFTVFVNNVDPVLVVAANQTVNEGSVLDLSAIGGAPPLGLFVDPGILDTHTATVDWGDGSSVESATVFAAPGAGALGGTHTYKDDGMYTVTVTVTDDDGGTDTAQFVVTVKNVPPVLVVTVDKTIKEGALLDLSGIGGAPPLGLFVDPGILDTHTATVNWGDGTPIQSPTIFPAPGAGALGATHTYADNGTYIVTVTVTDDDGGMDTKTFQVFVNNVAPALNVDHTDPTIVEGSSVSFDASFSDPGFDNPLNPGTEKSETFTYDLDWGDGRDIVTGVSVPDTNGSPGVPSTGMFSGSHTYADNGEYDVKITVYDDDGGVSATFVFTVIVDNVPPELTPPLNQIVNEGALLSLANLGMFSDPGFDNPLNPGAEKAETFTYDVDWGDGRDPITGMSIADANGGPGVPSTGTISGSHTYADNGVYTVTVTIYDDDGGSNVAMFTVTVNNVAPTLDVTPTTPVSINEGQTVEFDAMFSDPGFDNPLNLGSPTSESFRYFVDWGDGRDQVLNLAVVDMNGSPGVPSAGAFDGSHTFADDGVYTVTVRLADDDMSGNFAGGVAGVDYVEKTFTVTVTNVAPSLTGTTNVMVDEGTAFTLTGKGVGLEDMGFDNLQNPNSLPLPADALRETFRSFEINWGDGSATTPVSIDNVLDRTSGSPGVTTKALFTHAAHTYADDGVYTVTVRVADDNMSGNFASGVAGVDYVDLTFTITVKNVVPTLTQTTNKTIAESEDLVIPVLATFTDPGFDNPANLNGPSTESFSYFLDWGDGRDQIGSLAVADLNGAPGTPSSGTFGGTHNFADNGTYTVTIRLADDNMGAFTNAALFQSGVAGVDFVEQTFTVTVTNVGPSFTPQPNGENLAAPDVDRNGITTIFVAYNDPGYDNPLNTLASNGGETVETFNHVVQWGDGTVDAVHQYTTSGNFNVTVTVAGPGDELPPFAFANFSSTNPVLNLVSSQQLNDPSVVAQLYTFEVDWGDGHVETFQLSLLNPGVPVGVNGLTTLVASGRTSGNALTNTTGLAAIQHMYLGPPDPLHPTEDITITLSVYDDDGEFVTDTIDVGNPGITGIPVAIDTTPDVARLDLTVQPVTDVFVADAGGLAQLFQVPDVRGGGGEVSANTERYLLLRIIYPDGSESEGIRIKDEALADLRAFFKMFPDGHYAIYLCQSENDSERLVIEVDVRHGRVIDVSDDSEGTRDRPPTEEEGESAVPLNENPLLEAAPEGERQGDLETRRQGEVAESTETDDDRDSMSPPLLVSLSAAALAAQPWSRRVDDALAGADESAWQRLRRAGRRGRMNLLPKLATRSRMRAAAELDYNNKN